MKARTKLQIEVKELSDYKLPDISTSVVVWAEKTCSSKKGYRTKKRIACLKCGFVWKRDTNRKRCRCPHCQEKLEIQDTKSRTFQEKVYFSVLQVCGEFQVNRYFLLEGRYRVGETAQYKIIEVCQQWILGSGKMVVYAMRHKVSGSQDYWTGDFEIRTNNPRQYWTRDLYNIAPAHIYPKVEVLEEFRKRGINKMLVGITPLDLMRAVVQDNRAESLLKMGQNEVLEYYLYASTRYYVDRFWSSICICQRIGYKIEDVSMWFDYLENLACLAKDTRNAHYICPKNLRVAHDEALSKKRKMYQKRERDLDRMSEVQYRKDKANFIGLSFSDKDLIVEVLNSVQQFREEGERMRHCVYTNKYYLKPNSLILSAKIGDVSIATIELSLESWRVVQCRGIRNEEPPHKEQILSLIDRCVPELQRIKEAG